MTKIADLKKRLMENPEFLQEYEKADAEFRLVEALVNARTRANLSQAELARRVGTTQSAIARLEGGGVSPSVATLRRYAEATGMRLEINLVQP
jgi:DNA-binding XRE family transcriptional regulator